MYCVNGKPRSSLFIESTDSMIYLYPCDRRGAYKYCACALVWQFGSMSISSSSSAKCLGVIWSHNLSPRDSIDFNIKKARRAFFALRSLGISGGKQNPLTCSEIFEVCILPVCLYGCENWLLTDSLLQLLETFQVEIGKKMLNLPIQHANLCPLHGCDGLAINASTHPQEKAAFLSTTDAS